MLIINSCAMVIGVIVATAISTKCNEVGCFDEVRDLGEGVK